MGLERERTGSEWEWEGYWGKREKGTEQMSQGYAPKGLCPQQYKLLLSRNAYCIRTASPTDKEFLEQVRRRELCELRQPAASSCLCFVIWT